MKILIIPDSFKGSLSSFEFCKIVENELKTIFSDIKIESVPIGDGGEGTLDSILSFVNGKKVECHVQNSLYEDIDVPVGFYNNGRNAIVESSLSNGISLIKGRENPEITSSYGVGQMIGFAVDYGAKNILLTLGGSSTNDCGLGMLAALGACFYNKNGISFVPTGKTLCDVENFDFSQMYPRLVGAKIDALCDVENHLCGENGASKIFAIQKGADNEMVERLEKGCIHIKNLFQKKLGQDFSLEKGSGAAGGLGFAVISAFKGKLKSGIQTVLNLCNFEEKLKNCDLIITGEGQFDSQSLMGKAVGEIINRAKNCPVLVLCGNKKDDFILPKNVKVYEISKNQNADYAISHTKENLKIAIKEIFKENNFS